jgi:hypothetical protein
MPRKGVRSDKVAGQGNRRTGKRKVSILDFAPHKVCDQEALTRRELEQIWGVQQARMNNIIKSFIESGQWEAVLKRVGNRFIPAYRAKND